MSVVKFSKVPAFQPSVFLQITLRVFLLEEAAF